MTRVLSSRGDGAYLRADLCLVPLSLDITCDAGRNHDTEPLVTCLQTEPKRQRQLLARTQRDTNATP
eukprot:scaffold40574_cov27-Tisochrysis_lutea.AAC.19